jgi:intracellular multiplication protein IcmK
MFIKSPLKWNNWSATPVVLGMLLASSSVSTLAQTQNQKGAAAQPLSGQAQTQANPFLNGGAQPNQTNQTNQKSNNSAQVQPLPPPNLAGQAAPPPDPEKEAVDMVAPLSADQVRTVLEELSVRRAAAVEPIRKGLRAGRTSFDVDLSPGATPPVIRIARGQGSTINFIDSNGNPWPIEKSRNFYKEFMTVELLGESSLTVASKSDYLSGSFVVLLKGKNYPISISVVPAQDRIDSNADMKIAGLAPDATAPVGKASTSPEFKMGKLSDYLYGTTPAGARRLTIKGLPDATAWQAADGRLILRTAYPISSPGWYSRLPASDGTAVYELPAISVVSVSVDGVITYARIENLAPMKNVASADSEIGTGTK